jgi:hypothetical protein
VNKERVNSQQPTTNSQQLTANIELAAHSQ